MATITEIVNAVDTDTMSQAEAVQQLQALQDAAVQAVEQRTRYAAAALTGYIASGKTFPSRDALADECLAVADVLCSEGV